MGVKPIICKGQPKRWDMLTFIARFWSPENGFERIFQKFVFVLEISAVKVEELCGTNSRFHRFPKHIVGWFLSVTSLMILLWHKADFHGEHGFSFLGARFPESLFWRFLQNCWFHGSSFKGFSIVFPAPLLAKVESSQKLTGMWFFRHFFAPFLFHRSRNNSRYN